MKDRSQKDAFATFLHVDFFKTFLPHPAFTSAARTILVGFHVQNQMISRLKGGDALDNQGNELEKFPVALSDRFQWPQQTVTKCSWGFPKALFI